MFFKLVNSKEELKVFNDIIINFHSYVPTVRSVGRAIKWIILDSNTLSELGAISIGSSVYPPPKDILNYLGLNKNEYKKVFNSIGNNIRFCLNTHVKNLGTQVLKEFRNQSKVEWKNKYGDELKYIITFVGAGHTGAVYKADNWTMCGETSGLKPNHKSVSMKWSSKKELDENFVRPVGGEHKKLIFIKEI